ncbi:MAG: hypothetical protein ABII76_10025 [Pseudomonadota bacterium]
MSIIPEIVPEPHDSPPDEPKYEPTEAEIEKAVREAMQQLIKKGTLAVDAVPPSGLACRRLRAEASAALWKAIDATIAACPRGEGILEAAEDYLRWANS